MPINRDAALKEAEQLLRQGKLDGAIEAYVRLVEDRPSDWSSINALGDLCLRAGDVERAIAQFTRVADQFFSDGSLQKAAALYKKALRARDDHEPALQQLGEIAVRQGLQADAEVYLQRLAEQRQRRGDDHGAAESLARLGALKEAQTQSRNAAAMAAEGVADTQSGVTPDGVSADSIAAGDFQADDVAPLGSPQAPVPSESLDQSTAKESPKREAPIDDEVPFQAEALLQANESVEVDVPLEIEPPLETAGPRDIEAPREVELGAALDEMSSAPVETVDAPVDPTPSDHEQAPEESAGVDVAALEATARDAGTRFMAATALGRHYIRQGDVGTGIQWLERAAEATPASREEAFSALYDLADALESLGESPRALAVLIDLDLDSDGYRDGRARIDRLMAAQTRSDDS